MGFTIAVHGGAGLIRRHSLTPEREEGCREGLRAALAAGSAVLSAGGAALDAVVAAVVALEENPLFNAGRGAVLAADGTIELDAAVMDGRTRAGGAVAGVRTVRNPVLLARAVAERTPHVLLVGEGAESFAREIGLERVEPDWFRTPERVEQLEQARAEERVSLDHGGGSVDVYGTVGAVACDAKGHVAAATSTGGMVNKRAGRVGDTPILGAGTFAWDHTCAVSGTGHGEPFVKLGAAARVSARMELEGRSLDEAARLVMHADLPELQGEGGLIAVDARGEVALVFNSAGMFRGFVRDGGPPQVDIW
jgi:isoaspartyl peptidase/L-asparaginase-like protein (Ntn-hydrolase superfamily)